MPPLVEESCIACRLVVEPLDGAEITVLNKQLLDWTVVECQGEKQLKKAYEFKNFALALSFTNKVGELAEKEKHHPALLTEWRKVTVTWWTHSIGGLHQNDFILAARTDQLFID